LTHRIGGLEKEDGTGNVSYDPVNHEKMSHIRENKVKALLADIPDVEVFGDDDGLLVVTWGSPFGAVRTAVEVERAKGARIGHVDLRWLNPFPKNLKEVLQKAECVVAAELNMGQLARILRGEFLVDVQSVSKIQGQPFQIAELCQSFQKYKK
jgi:2-oxoglutarate ferredoxin oxidoreductase subunit alpha